VEASLQAHYNIDYRTRWTGDLTFRRLAVLIRYLPPDCALANELRDGPHWSIEAHVLDTIRMALTGSEKHKPEPWPGRFPAVGPDRKAMSDRKALLLASEHRRLAREKRLREER